MSITEVELDREELRTLLNQASRPWVRTLLETNINIQTTRLEQLRHQTSNAAAPSAAAADASGQSTRRKARTPIKTFGWDQSDKFVKLFVTVRGVHKLPADRIRVEFLERGFKLTVETDEAVLELNRPSLQELISPADSKFKVKTDELVVVARKAVSKSWEFLTLHEKHAHDKKEAERKERTEKMGRDGDPGAGLMDLMKQMYDEGDDEMKRTIGKAWTESREKQASGEL